MRLTRRAVTVGALAMLGTGTVAGSGLAQAKTTVSVQYPLGFIFDKVFGELKTEFEKANLPRAQRTRGPGTC